ncbi:hypothetical protein [Rhizobium leguminosarum]|uniref:hypothetical protein n=1 Tax=Rhizobium leguminosarum TaxID=384 RepID=UPI001AE8DC5B|nr:hypothetical protein [Rhizobium leguminosarum]MBP2448757.1 hypothetical protein [Rhizobium leguminosarum]
MIITAQMKHGRRNLRDRTVISPANAGLAGSWGYIALKHALAKNPSGFHQSLTEKELSEISQL